MKDKIKYIILGIIIIGIVGLAISFYFLCVKGSLLPYQDPTPEMHSKWLFQHKCGITSGIFGIALTLIGVIAEVIYVKINRR